MKRLLLLVALVLVVAPTLAEMAGGPEQGEFQANVKPEVTEVDVSDYYFLASYFYWLPRNAPPFDWCWSQPVVGWADEIRISGNWVFCGRENWMVSEPINPQVGTYLYNSRVEPYYYVTAGIIQTDQGDIYTMTYRTSAWKGEVLEGFGGLTRFFGGTGVFNYALGWATDRPATYPPSSWTRTQGAIEVLQEGTQAHPRSQMTPLEFPARVPGHIGPGSSWFTFEAKKGWSYRFGTTLGTLDDSLVAIWGHIEGPDECDCGSREQCMGYWWEDDGLWDGEGSDLGPVTAPADCVYYMEVLDWGRDGTSGTGTYTLWGNEYPPVSGTDADGDGVEDDIDLCPGTTIPESVPTVSFEYNRYALIDDDGVFDSIRAPDAGPGPTFTIEDTAGCSCEQIVESTGERLAQLKYGCTVKTMREWVEAVSP